MGTNRRYGSPSERAGGRERAVQLAALTPVMPRVRHVLVRLAAARGAPTRAGLIVSWERTYAHATTSGWSAQVAYTDDDGALHVSWFPLEQLEPVLEPVLEA